MPNIKSKAELRFMQAIVHGAKPYSGKGPSPATAREIIGPKGTHYGKLPEKAKKKKK
jgi:hypothetical protein